MCTYKIETENDTKRHVIFKKKELLKNQNKTANHFYLPKAFCKFLVHEHKQSIQEWVKFN